ncbi:MAG: hypothetical protein KGY69_19980 [Bacteroidales bacterium]|nr:hypothetical protein [Bacteroidales bacterium]
MIERKKEGMISYSCTYPVPSESGIRGFSLPSIGVIRRLPDSATLGVRNTWVYTQAYKYVIPHGGIPVYREA